MGPFDSIFLKQICKTEIKKNGCKYLFLNMF